MAYAYFIQTYSMPDHCGTWIEQKTLPTMRSEEDCYQAWKREVERVRDEHPEAKVTRRLNRRTAEEAFSDRESSICSREWTETVAGRVWKYRVTMYVIRMKEGYNVQVVEHYLPRFTEWRIIYSGIWIATAYSQQESEQLMEFYEQSGLTISKAA